MPSDASFFDDEDPSEEVEGGKKRKKRYNRSRNGCITCRVRKVKCDEKRPVCHRCITEHRDCNYNEVCMESPGRPVQGYSDHQQSQWVGVENEAAPSIASTSRHAVQASTGNSFHGRPAVTGGGDHTAPIQEARTSVVHEPTQYDDWLAFLFSSSTNSASHSNLDSELSEWMSSGIFLPDTTISTPTPSTLYGNQQLVPFHPAREIDNGRNGARTNLSTDHRRRVADSTLQQRLRELCTSDVQFEAVSQFFNFVAQCFHLLTAEVNSWRRVYAELSCQSPLTLNLVTCVGLISLSLIGPVNRRPLAYALLTKSISEWQSIVTAGQEGQVSQLSELQVLEIIAGAILIGHVEQFDTGLAIHTIVCMKETRKVVDAVVERRNCNVNLTQGSHFRFLIRAFLWWDTLSKTMGISSSSTGLYPKNSFDMVRYWEEDEGEEVIETSQCISGWPLDLLEAVARTQALSDYLESNNGVGSTSTRIEMKSIESQIRNCRPKVVFQDTKHTILIAELRYIVYEALQAGANIYFNRKLGQIGGRGNSKSVLKDVEKVIGFLNRRDVQGDQSVGASLQSQRETTMTMSDEDESVATINSPQSRPYYLTNVMKKRGVWKERAPDGALLWAYLQSAIVVEDSQTQEACRETLSRWETFKDFGAVSLQFELLELIWERRRQDIEHRFTEEEIWNKVLSERRWRQLLIF